MEQLFPYSAGVNTLLIIFIYMIVGYKFKDGTKFLACHNIYLMLNAAASIVLAILMLTDVFHITIRQVVELVGPGYIILLVDSIRWMMLANDDSYYLKFTVGMYNIHAMIAIMWFVSSIDFQLLIPYILLWIGSFVFTSFANAYSVATPQYMAIITLICLGIRTIWRISICVALVILDRTMDSVHNGMLAILFSNLFFESCEITYYGYKIITILRG